MRARVFSLLEPSRAALTKHFNKKTQTIPNTQKNQKSLAYGLVELALSDNPGMHGDIPADAGKLTQLERVSLTHTSLSCAGADAIDVSTPGAVVVNRTAGAVSLQFAVSAVSLACLCPATFSHSAACLPAFSHAALLARPAPHPVPRSLARTPARPSPLQTTLAAFTQAAATQVDLAVACSAGAYGITVTGGKICALCPAGSYSDAGTGCTSCPTGTAVAAVGTSASATCAACAAGTYAADGSSDCIPCAAGTYQDQTTSGSCTTW